MYKQLAAIAAMGLALAPAFAGAAPVGPRLGAWIRPASVPGPLAGTFTFTTLDDSADPTFNQLLGINDAGTIVGYFGIGSVSHPNKGYRLVRPYGQNNYINENYPGSVQTQVVAINNMHDTAGFWVDGANKNFGFVEWKGVFTSYRNPHTGTGTVNQLLGLNDAGIAVGFYTDGKSVNHGYELNQATGQFTAIVPPGGTNVTAAGINDNGDVTGFATGASGAVIGFLLKGNTFSEFSFPGAISTMPFGINKRDQIVGTYMDASGLSHGFLLSNPLQHARWQTIDDPNGMGTTLLNGLNDRDDLVGFYVDAAGNTDGFLAQPQ